MIIKAKRFCLTRLGSSLNVALLVMKSVITAIKSWDQEIKNAMSAYVNDIFIDESIVSAARVWQHLADYGLVCKDPEWLRDGVKVLGLQVWGEDDSLRWKRGSKVPEILRIVTYFLCVENWLATSLCLVGKCFWVKSSGSCRFNPNYR